MLIAKAIILILVLFLQITRLAKQDGLFGIKPRIYEYVFFIAVFIIFTLLFYQSFQQFEIWSQDKVSKFLLPPYQTLDYFIFYSFFRFFAPYLISLLAAFLFLFTAKFLNKKYQERFFEPEEFWIAALGFFLISYPGWIFYFLAILIITLIGSAVTRERFSLYYWWMPTAIFVILIIQWLQVLPLWNLLKL